MYLSRKPCRVKAHADMKARYMSMNMAPTDTAFMLPPAMRPAMTSITPPIKNWYPESTAGSSFLEKILTNPAAMAEDRPEKMMKPSPVSVKSKVNSPPRLISMTPPKPRMHPASFTRLNFSVRNRKHAASMVKNTPRPLSTDDFTPDMLDSPM